MTLAELLAQLPPHRLDALASQHLRPQEDTVPRPLLCARLEGILRSFRFVQDFVLDRRPPTFSLLNVILDVPAYSLAEPKLRELASRETEVICRAIDEEALLQRSDQLRLYRRVLYEARQGGIDLDASESAILGVLRRELGIFHVEHFLIEHHSDLREFWAADGDLDRELAALQSGGILFRSGELVVLAEDLAPLIRQALGIDMPRAAAQRLYAYLSNIELATALVLVDAAAGGAKEERVTRLLPNFVQPRAVLPGLSLESLRAICRDAGAAVSGAKDELVERIVGHFAGLDRPPPEPQAPEPVREERVLDERHFRRLFESLRGGELADILESVPELRRSGTKEVRAATLWESHRSEVTLLSVLKNRHLEDVLLRLGLKTGGSKGERIARIVQHFEGPVLAIDDRQ